jgi:glycerol-3-phosphate acyltransferase PlsY
MDDLIEYLGSYLIGSIPMALLVLKMFKKKALPKKGKNMDEMEAWKSAGLPLGLVIVALNLLKGATAVFMAHKFSPADPPDMVVAGFLVLMGDRFPVFLKFKGTSNLCTMVGVFAALLACLMMK